MFKSKLNLFLQCDYKHSLQMARNFHSFICKMGPIIVSHLKGLIRIKLNNASTALCPVPSSQEVLNSHSLIIVIMVSNSGAKEESTNYMEHHPKTVMPFSFLSFSAVILCLF